MLDEIRSLGPWQRQRVEQRLAVLAYAQTCSLHAAALYFGVSYRTVRRWRVQKRRAGLRQQEQQRRGDRAQRQETLSLSCRTQTAGAPGRLGCTGHGPWDVDRTRKSLLGPRGA
jgi:transposase